MLSALAMMGLCVPGGVAAAAAESVVQLDLTTSTVGYLALVIFAGAYALVMAEEFTRLLYKFAVLGIKRRAL